MGRKPRTKVMVGQGGKTVIQEETENSIKVYSAEEWRAELERRHKAEKQEAWDQKAENAKLEKKGGKK